MSVLIRNLLPIHVATTGAVGTVVTLARRWMSVGAWPTLIPKTWSYTDSRNRDLRLDLLRGFLLFAMTVDHIGGNSWLYAITGGDRFLVSAAEGFVFISGLVMGIVYRQVIRRSGLLAAVRKALRRAGELYLTHAILTFGFVAVSALTGAPWYEPLSEPIRFAFGVLMLRQSYYMTDVIHLYAVLILAAPLALWALARGQSRPLLLGSVLLWAAYQAFPEKIPTLAWGTAFPAAAWQILFVIGMVLGYHRDHPAVACARVSRSRALIVLLAGAAALVALSLLAAPLFPAGSWARQVFDWAFYKYAVRPGRLIAAAVFFPLAYLVATVVWQPLRVAFGGLLLTLGQNSLYAYALHLMVFIVIAGGLARLPWFSREVVTINTLVQLAGVGLIWAMVKARGLVTRLTLPHPAQLQRA